MGLAAPPIRELVDPSSFPELAIALRAATSDLLRIWRDETQRLLPLADRFTREQFEDGIPKILGEIADALECGDSRTAKSLIADGSEHGDVRFHQRFNLNEMLIEYTLLRRVLLEQVASRLDRPMTAAESIAINVEIDVALRQSTVAFANHQAEQLTTEATIMAKYLSFLSHDLRGGLNGSILMIEVLRRSLMGEPRFAESISDLDMMRRSMFDTVATMDRFLHAERLRRGKMPVRIGKVDLDALLRKIVHNFNHQIVDLKTTVTVDVQLEGALATDGDVLTIILQNLLGNAIKYCCGKPIRLLARPRSGRAMLDGNAIEISGTASTRKPLNVRISIEDLGPGMSAESIATLFQPFERGETYGQNGTGLGMTIARQAADLLGATLSVESSPGQGTTFHIDL